MPLNIYERVTIEPGGTMADETWTDRVRVGDFSAIPLPLTWAKSYDLARMIDGYAVAEAAGITDLADQQSLCRRWQWTLQVTRECASADRQPRRSPRPSSHARG
jgi:hypothetical protein